MILSASIVFGQAYTISTVAGDHTIGSYGNPSPALAAQFDFPQCVAVDKAGNVYISDTFNNVVREVTVNGTIQTIAGNGTRGYSGDSGPAINAELSFPLGLAFDASGNLYIADSSNDVIRILTTDGNISTFAGNNTRGYSGDSLPATAAQLYSPTGIVVDTSGDVFFSDSGNHAIREVASNGIIITVGGNGSPGYSGDGGYIGGARFNYPKGLAMDTAGNIYIADFGNSAIRKIAASNGAVTTVAGTSAGFSGDGGPATAAQLAFPEGVAVDSSANLYIADSANHRIRYVSGGNIQTIAGNGQPGYSGDGGPPANAQFFYPNGIAVSSTGNVYIADLDNNVIRLLSPAAH
jgi:sugar lactone lactonase YvrE